MRFVVVAFLIFILFSLASAGYFLVKDRGRTTRTVKALTIRVALSILLFALLMLSFKLGFIPERF